MQSPVSGYFTHTHTHKTQHLKRVKHERTNSNNSVSFLIHIYTSHTFKIIHIKIRFNVSYVKLPHNAQQETKHRDTTNVRFGIIYKQTENP